MDDSAGPEATFDLFERRGLLRFFMLRIWRTLVDRFSKMGRLRLRPDLGNFEEGIFGRDDCESDGRAAVQLG